MSNGNEEVEDGRESWGNQVEYVLAAMGYAVGVGNVWRFPYLAYRFGGGTFLVPYFLSLVFLGIPLFMLESIMGQVNRRGLYDSMKKIHPRLRGLGVAAAILLFFASIYYNILITWSLYFTGRSFEDPLPWSAQPSANGTVNGTDVSVAAEVFWFNEVLQRSKEPFLPTKLVPHLVGTLVLSWILVFLALSKGVKSSGKVVYFTVTMPFLLLFILLGRALTLEGAEIGVRFYLTPVPEQLGDVEVWVRASQQIFYSLGVGWGTLIALASYNKPHYNTIRNSLIITLTNSITSLIAGLVVFGVIGHLSFVTGLPVDSVVEQGSGLTFVVIPEALGLFPLPQLFSVLFFFMLLLLGVDSQFAQVEALVTFLRDINTPGKIWQILGVVCIVCFLLGLLIVTDAGIDWFTLMDDYVAIFVLFLITFGMSASVWLLYGVDKLADEYKAQSGYSIPYVVQLCWKYICPVLSGLLLIAAGAFETYRTTAYPLFARTIGLMIGSVPFVPVVICALYPDLNDSMAMKWLRKKFPETTDRWIPVGMQSKDIAGVKKIPEI